MCVRACLVHQARPVLDESPRCCAACTRGSGYGCTCTEGLFAAGAALAGCGTIKSLFTGLQDPEPSGGGAFGFLRAMLTPEKGGDLRSEQIGAYYGHDNDIIKMVARDRFCVEASCDKICAHNMKVGLP